MNLDRFLADRRPAWDELETLLRRGSKVPERLGADGVQRMGALYRSAAADLAIARRRFPHDPVVPALEGLVRRSHGVVYRKRARTRSVGHFFSHGYWQRVRERPALLLLAAILLFAPFGLSAAWAHSDPGAAAGLLPGGTQSLTEPRPEGPGLGLSAGERSDFAAMIFTNNIQVTLLALAGGITAGLLTAGVLLFNGLSFGVVAGIAASAGNASILVQLTVPHGVLELSCIVVAGAAGFRVGWALISPGYRPRAEALIDEARAAVEIVLGTALWLVLAGLVEGFLTPTGLSVTGALIIGFGLGGVYWGLVFWRGRPSTDAGRTDDPPNW